MLKSLQGAGIAGAVLSVAAMLGGADPAIAAQRAFVSTSGVDNPTCSLPSPCRTFGAAITATSAGGEVIVLNSGGYGAVTITTSVSIIAPPGVYAGVSVSSGHGVVVATGASDSVTLRGLTINNVGSGVTGIRFTGDGRLQVEDVHVSGFGVEALLFAPTTSGDLVVERSSFSGNGWGIVVTPSGTANAVIDRVSTHHNAVSGVQVGERTNVVVRGSTASKNDNGVWCYGLAAATTATVSVESSDLSQNTNGLNVGGFSGNCTASLSNSTVAQNGSGVQTVDGGTVTLAGSSITRNGTGIAYSGSGVANSQGNNLISGNGSDGAAPAVVGSK